MSDYDTALKRDGIVWTYRLLLDRDPSEFEVQFAGQATPNTRDLRRALLGSREFMAQMDRPDRAPGILQPEEGREAVKWAFRLFLDREISVESDIQFMADHHRTVVELRKALTFSEEFRNRNDKSLYPLLTAEVVREFKPICKTAAAPGWFNDFLGNMTRCSFLPATSASISGSVQGPPGSIDNPPLHGAAEWVATLRAVLEARDRFTIVELGAGWAPWLISGRKAAQRKKIAEVHLLGIEGSLKHLEFARQNFRDNGLDPDAHQLMHGVVGVTDGVALFPALADSDENYGGAADYGGGTSSPAMVDVPCFSLGTLLAGLPPVVDLIHCDIQGSEAEVMGASLAILDQRVRRVAIGTHSRRIESLLLEQFSGLGWHLEHESVCTYRQGSSGHLTVVVDGTQVWRNPRL
jgi:FkbM family methyltransferase